MTCQVVHVRDMKQEIFNYGLKFKPVKVNNGLGSRTTALILNNYISDLKVIFYSAFKLTKLPYNTALIKVLYHSRIIINSF